MRGPTDSLTSVPPPPQQSAVAPIITLFEAYGAGAEVIGPRLAETLGVPYVRQVWSSEELEGQANPQEGWIGRFVASLVGPGAAEGALESAEEWQQQVRGSVARVLALKETGAVVLGHNATVILADHPGALHVKLDGPAERRVAYAAAATGIDQAHAARRLAREDRVRAEFSLALYGWDPRTNDRYHLVVNTSLFGVDDAVRIILAARERVS